VQEKESGEGKKNILFGKGEREKVGRGQLGRFAKKFNHDHGFSGRESPSCLSEKEGKEKKKTGHAFFSGGTKKNGKV